MALCVCVTARSSQVGGSEVFESGWGVKRQPNEGSSRKGGAFVTQHLLTALLIRLQKDRRSEPNPLWRPSKCAETWILAFSPADIANCANLRPNLRQEQFGDESVVRCRQLVWDRLPFFRRTGLCMGHEKRVRQEGPLLTNRRLAAPFVANSSLSIKPGPKSTQHKDCMCLCFLSTGPSCGPLGFKRVIRWVVRALSGESPKSSGCSLVICFAT